MGDIKPHVIEVKLSSHDRWWLCQFVHLGEAKKHKGSFASNYFVAKLWDMLGYENLESVAKKLKAGEMLPENDLVAVPFSVGVHMRVREALEILSEIQIDPRLRTRITSKFGMKDSKIDDLFAGVEMPSFKSVEPETESVAPAEDYSHIPKIDMSE